MTPQEKAISLVDSYRLILIKSDTDAGEEILCTLLAKECAFVAVDEAFCNNTDELKHDYWIEVKEEIEKL
jgi:hypothetical protein